MLVCGDVQQRKVTKRRSAWLGDEARFSLEPALTLNRGPFAPTKGQQIFGSIGDSAPDSSSRRLMQRAERRFAEREGLSIPTK